MKRVQGQMRMGLVGLEVDWWRWIWMRHQGLGGSGAQLVGTMLAGSAEGLGRPLRRKLDWLVATGSRAVAWERRTGMMARPMVIGSRAASWERLQRRAASQMVGTGSRAGRRLMCKTKGQMLAGSRVWEDLLRIAMARAGRVAIGSGAVYLLMMQWMAGRVMVIGSRAGQKTIVCRLWVTVIGSGVD